MVEEGNGRAEDVQCCCEAEDTGKSLGHPLGRATVTHSFKPGPTSEYDNLGR